MMYEAMWAGADLVKFQLYRTEKLHPVGSQYYDISKLNELTFEQAKELFRCGQEIGIEVFFSVSDVERVKWCEGIGVRRYKVACSQGGNNLLIYAINDTGKELIISQSEFKPLQGVFNSDVKYLYCIPQYPTSIDELEMLSILNYDGFSDHTIGLDVAKIALARGAHIIEKHFCLSRYGEGNNPDIAGSMLPSELLELRRWENLVKQVL